MHRGKNKACGFSDGKKPNPTYKKPVKANKVVNPSRPRRKKAY